MDNVALIFLSEDKDAQRLAVAWPKAAAGRRIKTLDASTCARWAELSGVHLYTVSRLGKVLLEHGICTFDGKTDESALAFIRRQIAKSVTRRAVVTPLVPPQYRRSATRTRSPASDAGQ